MHHRFAFRKARPGPIKYLGGGLLGFMAVLVLVFFLAACGGQVATTTTSGPTADPNIKAAQTFVSLLASGNFAAAERQFDAAVRQALPESQLQTVWQALEGQTGRYQSQVGVRTVRQAPYDAVFVTIQCANAKVDVEVTYDSQGQVAGLHFLPAGSSTTSSTVAYKAPAYVDPAAFTEQPVTVGAGTPWALPGTLSLPKGSGPFPVVVLVQGSGPSDRDETIGPNKPFRDLAWGLASQGVAVLRYDKRTFVYPTQVEAEISTFTVQQESIDDALAAAKLVRGLPRIDGTRIYVLGHSLGAMAAPRIGEQDPSLAGLIVMAGPTRPLEDVILDQETYLASLNGGPTASQAAQLKQLQAQIARVKDPHLSTSTPAQDLPLGLSAAYWLDLRGYQPAVVAKTLTMRLLVLQGARDYQVTTQDFAGWQAALSGHANTKLILYPDLNHLFMAGTGKSTPAEYEQPGHVDKQAIADIATWIKS